MLGLIHLYVCNFFIFFFPGTCIRPCAYPRLFRRNSRIDLIKLQRSCSNRFTMIDMTNRSVEVLLCNRPDGAIHPHWAVGSDKLIISHDLIPYNIEKHITASKSINHERSELRLGSNAVQRWYCIVLVGTIHLHYNQHVQESFGFRQGSACREWLGHHNGGSTGSTSTPLNASLLLPKAKLTGGTLTL